MNLQKKSLNYNNIDDLFSKALENSSITVSQENFNNILLDKAQNMFREMEDFIETLNSEIK